MSTRSTAPPRHKANKASESQSVQPANENPANGPRSPRPRVLARFPDMDAKDPLAEPAETFDDFNGRIVNQKVARRILVGMACVLVFAAILPLAFQRGGKMSDEDESVASTPSWQPENPAPEASVAPAWANAATQVGEETSPRNRSASEPAPNGGHTAEAERTASRDIIPDPAEKPGRRSKKEGSLANLGRAIVPPDEAALDGANHRAFGDADRVEPAHTHDADRRYPTVSSTANQASAIPDGHRSAGGYTNQYPAERIEPGYQQGYRPSHRAVGPSERLGAHDAGWDQGRPAPAARTPEPVATPYQGYRDDSTTSQWRDTSYRQANTGTVENRDYVAEPRTGDWSRRNPSAEGNYQASREAYYNPPQTTDYRAGQTAGYRSQPAPHYQPYPSADPRGTPQAAGYRSPPAVDTWSNPAAGAPVQSYRREDNSQLPVRNSQPAPGYYDGARTQAAPGQGRPYYQADGRSAPAAGYTPYDSQPHGAQLQGTIDPSPAPARYDRSDSRLY